MGRWNDGPRYMGRPIPDREVSKDEYVKKNFPENYKKYLANKGKKKPGECG